MSDLLKFSWQPELSRSTMIVSWNDDNSTLGMKIADYLIKKLDGRSFAEIDPVDFFSLGTVNIVNNVVQFPENAFYVCPEQELVIFKSPPPNYEWYQYLSLILDVARDHCQVQEIYTINGMSSLTAHTSARTIMATFNSPETKRLLSGYDLAGDWDFQTPPGGRRPRMTTFLLWAAKRRNIPAVRFWLPIPFYLAGTEDPGAKKRVLDFFSQRFHWQIDSADIEQEIRRQNEKLARIRQNFPDIDESIRKLENNLRLTDEESQKLGSEIQRLLTENEI
ncbi:MAG: PAC2 family protein [Chloroflexi bacterium]|nr:PAC2 family protein [Chloroflexota bacterium]